jgi:perosamine synthetase
MRAIEQLAIHGGTPVRRSPFPPWPVLGEEDGRAAAEVLRSGQLTSLTGGKVAEFEAAFARYHSVKHALATSSGTTAIHLALAAAGIRAGDEVIVPAHTFIASATPVLHQGAVPVFADVDRDTFNLLPASVEKLISPRTRAVIAVHLNGHPAPMDELLALAERHSLTLIEDAAQAHGALCQGRLVGTMTRIGCFSFWEDKIMTTAGEGGAVITNDDALAETIFRLRSHGEGPIVGERRYYHLDLGYNYRLSAVQAAVGLVQLSRLDEYLAARRRNAAYLTERLRALPGVEAPVVANHCTHSYYKYICRLRRDILDISVDDFVAAVVAEGVPVSRRYPTPLHRQPVFREAIAQGRCRFEEGSCPNAEALAEELFTLQVHPTVQEKDLSDVAAAIEKVAAAYGR